ncbi:hypothetical protein GCM10010429_29490 [Micromonospora olivasterospora]
MNSRRAARGRSVRGVRSRMGVFHLGGSRAGQGSTPTRLPGTPRPTLSGVVRRGHRGARGRTHVTSPALAELFRSHPVKHRRIHSHVSPCVPIATYIRLNPLQSVARRMRRVGLSELTSPLDR